MFLIKIREYVRKPVAQNTLYMLCSYACRVFFQLTTFFFVARRLGPAAFGEFAALYALISLLSPFIELGGYTLIIRDITRDIPPRKALGNVLIVAVWTVPLGVIAAILLKVILLPTTPFVLFLTLTIASFAFGRMISLLQAVNVATSHLWKNVAYDLANGLLSIGFVGILYLQQGGIHMWIWLSAAQVTLVSLGGLYWFVRKYGVPHGMLNEGWERVTSGFHIAIGSSAQNASMDLDKAMLARLSTLEDAGIYAAAQKITTAAFLPVNAFLSAIYPKFFLLGKDGHIFARNYAKKALFVTIPYGVAVSSLIWFLAPYSTYVLGEKFQESQRALSYLAVIPLLQGIYWPFADALNGSGLQVIRARFQVIALTASVILNLVLIHKMGWLGAATASIISHTILLCSYCLVKK
jgi:O-antigen/teichoic acid export membrane protein